jgi:hypothetical protein
VERRFKDPEAGRFIAKAVMVMNEVTELVEMGEVREGAGDDEGDV